MRICLIAPTFPPRKGGLETHIATLAKGLVRRHHNVIVITNRDHWSDAAEESANGLEVFRVSQFLLDMNQPEKVPWEEAVFGVLGEFAAILQRYPVDIIHTHTQVSLLIATLSAPAVPIVASFHETEPQTEPCGLARSRHIVGTLPYSSIIAGSKYFAQQALTFGATKSKVKLVYYGLSREHGTQGPVQARELLCSTMGVPQGIPLILMTGRFKPRKGHLQLLEAFKRLASKCEAHVLMIGSCSSGSQEYLEAVRQGIVVAGLSSQITVAAECSPPILSAALQCSAVVTQPSTVEGFGLAALEGMLMSKPVVAANVPGLDEIVIDGETGLLIDTSNASDYCGALHFFIQNPEAAVAFGKRGLDRAQSNFSSDRMVSETIDVYEESCRLHGLIGSSRQRS